MLPFPPGPTLAERYRDRDDYAPAARRVARRSFAGRFLLNIDVHSAVESAVAAYDAVAEG